MTTTRYHAPLSSVPFQRPLLAPADARAIANRRLDDVFAAAPRIRFDDSSRFVLFSDCHRGDSSQADVFAQNEGLFCHALDYYYREGYSYVEVGDGDELWRTSSFDAIRKAHEPTYERLHRFDQAGRLLMILGNHDLQGRAKDRIDKDGLVAREGLVLAHNGTRQRILVTHGHQVDLKSDRYGSTSRFLVRNIWGRLSFLGLDDKLAWREDPEELALLPRSLYGMIRMCSVAIERRITRWIAARGHPVICGHTHVPACASYGTPPYFNTGNCVTPGCLTGLELEGEWITPIRWTVHPDQRVERRYTGAPRRLSAFAA